MLKHIIIIDMLTIIETNNSLGEIGISGLYYYITRRPKYLETHRCNSPVDVTNYARSTLNMLIESPYSYS